MERKMNWGIIVNITTNILSHYGIVPGATPVFAECYQGNVHAGDQKSFSVTNMSYISDIEPEGYN
jgi:hypothetical protein